MGQSKPLTNTKPFTNSPIKASDIIGTHIVNHKDESLGEIKELVIDPVTGRVAYVAVSFGGFLSLGEKLFAIPFSSFAYSVSKKKYVLNITRERMEAAPGFDADHWPSMTDEAWNRHVYKYYERAPYWE